VIEFKGYESIDHGPSLAKMTASVDPNPIVETVGKPMLEVERIIVKRKKVKRRK
jgi:hypothetical protein